MWNTKHCVSRSVCWGEAFLKQAEMLKLSPERIEEIGTGILNNNKIWQDNLQGLQQWLTESKNPEKILLIQYVMLSASMFAAGKRVELVVASLRDKPHTMF